MRVKYVYTGCHHMSMFFNNILVKEAAQYREEAYLKDLY